ncbi:MAG: type II toxin-antitoxin system Phd/YefM family antitoxin [Chloroflexi bacterium]|nr:type II toxin-antitoxin system Phd/YefM family antitoxin [Chloroflexota bacterium]
MARELKRVRLGPNTNLVRILEDVHTDKTPRLIEREGEPLAVVINPEDYTEAAPIPKSKRHKNKLLDLAGVWSDLDADRMIDDLYKARHEAPPSAPIKL